MKFCTKCGKQMNDGDRFCPACGTPQTSGAPAQSEWSRAEASAVFSAGRPDRYDASDAARPVCSYDASEGARPVYSYDTSDGDRPMYTYDTQNVGGELLDLYAQPAPSDGDGSGVRKTKRPLGRRLIPVFGAAAAVLVLLIVFLVRSAAGGGSITKNGAVKAYYKALQTQDGRDLFNATISDSMLKALKEQSGFTKKQLISLLEASMRSSSSVSNRYRHIEIEDADRLDRDDVEQYIDEMEEQTGTTLKISSIYRVEVGYEVWNSYYEEWTEGSDRLMLYKSAGKWYVLPDSVNF